MKLIEISKLTPGTFKIFDKTKEVTEKGKHGGTRIGAGRPTLNPDKKKIPVEIGIQKCKIDKHGGVSGMKKRLLKYVDKLK